MTAGDTRRTVSQSGGITTIQDPNVAEVSSVITFTDGDTTPSVLGGRVFRTANSAETTITDFDGVTTDGYMITVILDANTILDHGNTKIDLAGGIDARFGARDVFEAIYDGDNSVWLGNIRRID